MEMSMPFEPQSPMPRISSASLATSSCFNRRGCGQSGQASKNGQFLSRLAQDVLDLFVASHTDKGIERLLVHVVATALAINWTPTLQLTEPAYDRGTGTRI